MYSNVFVAGTFDGIHKGHESLLMRAFSKGRKVIIGLTSDEFVKKFKIQNSEFRIRKFEIRERDLKQWLKRKKYISRVTLIPIDDPYEPAASMTHLDALVVSTDTKFRGEEINGMREKRGLPKLVLLEVSMVPAEDGKPVSSTRIHNGEVDRDGRLVMPESLRSELSQPLGTLLTGERIRASIMANKEKIRIAVGDVATKTLLDSGVTPALSIIDFRVGRKPSSILSPYKKSIVLHSTRVKSGPGYISKKAMQAIQAILKGKEDQKRESKVIIIDGEEDLLALSVIHYAPIGSVVYYGQPGEGLVKVIVTEVKKQQVIEILKKFS